MPPSLIAPRKPDALLWAVALVALTYIWRFQELVPLLGKVKLPILAMAAAIGLLATDRHPARKLARLKGPILYLVAGLTLVIAAGVPGSLWTTASAMFLIKEYPQLVVALVLFAASVRSSRDVEWLLLVNLFGALIYSLFVMMYARVGGARDRLGNLYYYDSNDYGLLLAASIPIAIYFLRRGTPTARRLFALFSMMVLVLMLVKSGSRGAFLAFGIVMGYVALRFRAFPARTRMGAVVGGVVLLGLFANQAFWDNMKTMLQPKQDYNWTDPTGRKAIWTRGIGYMLANPLVGTGARTFGVAEGTLSTYGQWNAQGGQGFKWSVAHNSFVEVGAELGVTGLAIFTSLFVVSFLKLRRVRSRQPWLPRTAARDPALAQALTASFIAYAVAGFFVSAEWRPFLFFLLAMVIGLTRANARPVMPPGWTPAARRGPRGLRLSRAAGGAAQAAGAPGPHAG